VLELTLVVSASTTAAASLCRCLEADGMPARQVLPEDLLHWSVEADGVPDLLLFNATVEVTVVRAAIQRIIATASRPPTVVAFVEDDLTILEPHVLAGLDYIVPPYLPGQVRSRLLSHHLRQALSRTAEEIQTVGNLLKYERELQIGREIQAGFLPESLPVRTGWQLTARFHPAREVAGDFYDAFEVCDGTRIGLLVADVCDKGVGAALFMALIRTLLRHTAVHLPAWDRPGSTAGTQADAELLMRAVCATNNYLVANHLRQAYFATLFFAVLDPASGSLVYINCGHNPPVLRRARGGYRLLAPTGPALGLLPDSVFDLGRVRLHGGDLLFAYTDGLPEARDEAGRFFTTEVMLGHVRAPHGGADGLLDWMDQEVSAHIGAAERTDDLTMVALRRTTRRAVPVGTRRGRDRPARPEPAGMAGATGAGKGDE
jgi:sigma-B regulation protein RsbU (phosphoserine phosphatase)